MNLQVGFGSARQNTIDETLQRALDGRQRRAQLVTDVGDEPAAHGFHFIEPAGHFVEAHGELGELILTIDIHAFLVVPGSDAL